MVYLSFATAFFAAFSIHYKHLQKSRIIISFALVLWKILNLIETWILHHIQHISAGLLEQHRRAVSLAALELITASKFVQKLTAILKEVPDIGDGDQQANARKCAEVGQFLKPFLFSNIE